MLHIVGRRECFRLLSTLPPPFAHPRNNNTLRARRQCHTYANKTRALHRRSYSAGPVVVGRGLFWGRGGGWLAILLLRCCCMKGSPSSPS